jgi:hypothetical protein
VLRVGGSGSTVLGGGRHGAGVRIKTLCCNRAIKPSRYRNPENLQTSRGWNNAFVSLCVWLSFWFCSMTVSCTTPSTAFLMPPKISTCSPIGEGSQKFPVKILQILLVCGGRLWFEAVDWLTAPYLSCVGVVAMPGGVAESIGWYIAVLLVLLVLPQSLAGGVVEVQPALSTHPAWEYSPFTDTSQL